MTPEAQVRRSIDQFGVAKETAPTSTSVIAYFIDVEVVLCESPAPFLAQLPFLGGVLHGAINQTLHESAASNTPAWRLIAPPCRTVFANGACHGAWLLASGALRFGVVVHGKERAHVLGLLSAVQRVQWLGSGDERLQVKDVQCRIRPVHAPVPKTLAACHAARVQLNLTWLTPLHMASRAQVAAGHAQGLPPLLRIVRSLTRRAMECQHRGRRTTAQRPDARRRCSPRSVAVRVTHQAAPPHAFRPIGHAVFHKRSVTWPTRTADLGSMAGGGRGHHIWLWRV
jgi:hypothetical protein